MNGAGHLEGLLHDIDGTGPIAAIQFAQLPIGLGLTRDDFLFA